MQARDGGRQEGEETPKSTGTVQASKSNAEEKKSPDAQSPGASSTQVVVYADANYGGASQEFAVGRYQYGKLDTDAAAVYKDDLMTTLRRAALSARRRVGRATYRSCSRRKPRLARIE